MKDTTLIVIAGPPLPGRAELARAVAASRHGQRVRLDEAGAEVEVRARLAAGEDVVVDGDFATRDERRACVALAGEHRLVLAWWVIADEQAERVVAGRFAARPSCIEEREREAWRADAARREPLGDEVPAEQVAVVPGAAALADQLLAVEALLTPREAPAARAPRRRRVLVVDDDPDVRDALEMVLVELGYDVESAESGDAALARMSSGGEDFDLVVADQRMPGLSGTELLARIGTLYPSVRTLLLTGFGDDVTCDEALRAKATTVLSKPLRVIDLQRALEEALP